MNNHRMPFYVPMAPGNPDFHGYRPQYNMNSMNGMNGMNGMSGMRPDLPANIGWDRSNQGNAWKHSRNRPPPKYQRQPYTIPNKKPYNNNGRYQPNKFENGSPSYRSDMGGQGQPGWAQSASGWPSQQPPGAKKVVKAAGTQDHKDIEHSIPGTVATKKKRKPMSKSYPSGKWDEKDAEKALQTEKDFTKSLKNQSLIIRFPDPDLNKDIVKQFHPAIENVHFPQASTPRYCFVHLQDNTDLGVVVGALEKIRFGQGCLSVEIKKAREDNTEFSPKDIDPLTLYVGNLPMNVTKAGVMEIFPSCTRIDIGHPQQMKNTRYAFVRFSNVDDAIGAYTRTRNTQYESRSLIVRFRRLNGNVGVPGESKTPNPPRTKAEVVKAPSPGPSRDAALQSPLAAQQAQQPAVQQAPQPAEPGECGTSSAVAAAAAADLSLVKHEPVSEDEDEEAYYEAKPDVSLLAGLDAAVKQEIKTEQPDHVSAYDKNEDEVDDDEDDDDDEYYMDNDNFQYNADELEDEHDESEDDSYEAMADDEEMELNAHNTWAREDDDNYMFNGGLDH